MLGCRGLPIAIDPTKPSKWLLFCVKCRIIVQVGIGKVRLLDRLTKEKGRVDKSLLETND